MLIIGEKINGTLAKVAIAIANRDAPFIRSLAGAQKEAGAHYLDLNAGSPPDREPDDLVWLVETVQSAVDLPLCLDSSNQMALAAALQRVKQRPIINSINSEKAKLESILPLISKYGCSAMAMLIDEAGVPNEVISRQALARNIIAHTRQAGIQDKELFVDPLVMSIATNTGSTLTTLETMRSIREEFPEVRFCAGLSNVSFGLPARRFVNRAFLVLALAAGLDAAIIDPLDKSLYTMLLATELLLNRDKHCRNYTRSYRQGKIG
ncbi:MAG: dihydropteroate synthase [Candidatus Tectomicrobia bacterium]|uniref:Dihydropteroate synthase n=1 Tax=Tectimicrobiota bacterium TaxID=2528274 RepID=A0A933GKQ4_UNCTE|nr:dihydropteroate synthase [Candidatus Tectomicrobia bacterium]